jgi:hypothetical protein
MARFFWTTLVLTAAWLAASCGDSGGDDLFSGDASAGAAGTVAGGTGGSAASGGFSGGSGGSLSSGGTGGGTGGSLATTGGTGGATVDGSAGAAGSAAKGGEADAATDGPPGTAGAGTTFCGTTPCDLASKELCCVHRGGTLTQPSAECATSGSGCDITLTCDGKEDCPDAQICCGVVTTGLTGTRTWQDNLCQDACDSDDVPLGCSGPHNCATGEICCGTWVQTGIAAGAGYYSGIECASTCQGTSMYILCETQDDCVNGGTCQASAALPFPYLVCR